MIGPCRHRYTLPLKRYAPMAFVGERHAAPVREAAKLLRIRCNAPFPPPHHPDVSLRGAKRRGNLAVHSRITGYSRRNRNCLPEIAPQGHFLALRAQGATAPSGPRNDKAGGFPHSSFFSLQDSFISVPLPYNTRLTALQNFPLSIFDFPRSPILFFSVFLYKYFRIESAKIRKKINKVRKYP